MKRFYRLGIIILLGIIYINPKNVIAARGCCSSHGGVCGCNAYGRQICCDGTLSPSCTCTPPPVYGCTDRNAKNYNYNANTNDGSCIYDIKGCMNEKASNYNKDATIDDGSCIIMGCKDKKAKNYNSEANQDDGSCQYEILGCTDPNATNYNAEANKDNGKCKYKKEKKNQQENIDPVSSDVGDETNDEDMAEYISFMGLTNGFGLITIGGIGGYTLYNKKKKKKNNYCRNCGKSIGNSKNNYCSSCGNKVR